MDQKSGNGSGVRVKVALGAGLLIAFVVLLVTIKPDTEHALIVFTALVTFYTLLVTRDTGDKSIDQPYKPYNELDEPKDDQTPPL